jgi:Acyltransferase
MEKFRSTADPSTGVHPFIPVSDCTTLLSRLVFVMFFSALRACVLLLGVGIACFGSLSSSAIGMISVAIARPFVRVGHAIGLRAVLLAFGVWKYTGPTLEHPRSRACVVNSGPRHGDIIFCNHSSYLDPIYLACAYSPVFVASNATGKLSRLSLFEAVWSSVRSSASPGGTIAGDAVESLTRLATTCATRKCGPVVVFAEGATTNGAGVLQFSLPPLQLSQSSVFALGLRYSTSRVETYTIGSALLHALQRLTSSRSEIRSRIAGVALDANLQRAVADLAGIPPLGLGAEARDRFEAHMAQSACGY